MAAPNNDNFAERARELDGLEDSELEIPQGASQGMNKRRPPPKIDVQPNAESKAALHLPLLPNFLEVHVGPDEDLVCPADETCNSSRPLGQWNTRAEMLQHIHQQHPEFELIPCRAGKCTELYFWSKLGLCSHETKHHYAFQCPACGIRGLSKHMQRHTYSHNVDFICRMCGKVTINKGSGLQHSVGSCKGIFECTNPHCALRFTHNPEAACRHQFDFFEHNSCMILTDWQRQALEQPGNGTLLPDYPARKELEAEEEEIRSRDPRPPKDDTSSTLPDEPNGTPSSFDGGEKQTLSRSTDTRNLHAQNLVRVICEQDPANGGDEIPSLDEQEFLRVSYEMLQEHVSSADGQDSSNGRKR